MTNYMPTETDIDVSLGILPFEEDMVARSSTKSFANLSIRLPTPEGQKVEGAIPAPVDLTLQERQVLLPALRIEVDLILQR